MRGTFFALILLIATAASAAPPQIELTVGQRTVSVEVAATGDTRATGLMHRRILPENNGMLFVFPAPGMHAFWMMNTHIPLSIAFIDDEGTIVNIENMQPHTQNSHPPKRPVRYALEMNQGWFAKHGIRVGARIKGLDRAPPAR